MDVHFLDATFDGVFRADQQRERILSVFVTVAILVACLGLYGLAAFATKRRTQEIGIRKVFGANVWDILRLLLWQFSVPVLLANIVAWPIAWYYLTIWLQSFASRIWLSPVYFVAAGLVALAIAWLMVATHALAAARTRPTRALRTWRPLGFPLRGSPAPGAGDDQVRDIRNGRLELGHQSHHIRRSDAAHLDHESELDLDAGQTGGSRRKDCVRRLSLLRPGVALLLHGRIKAKESRFGAPAPLQSGELTMQVLGILRRGAGIPEDSIDVLVGVGQIAPPIFELPNCNHRRADGLQKLRLEDLNFVTEAHRPLVEFLPLGPERSNRIRSEFGIWQVVSGC